MPGLGAPRFGDRLPGSAGSRGKQFLRNEGLGSFKLLVGRDGETNAATLRVLRGGCEGSESQRGQRAGFGAVSRAFAENQTDEEGTTLGGDVEDDASLLDEAKRPAELGAGVTPEFGKGRACRVDMLE